MTQLLAPKMSPIEITRLLSVAVNVYSPNQYTGIFRMVRIKSAILSFLLCSVMKSLQPDRNHIRFI